MDQRQFEQSVLQLVHARRVDRLTPSTVANEFGLSVKDAEKALDRMVTEGTLELDSDDEGNLFYFVPGLGTAGVFTQGTSAANPSEPPQPPAGGPAPWTPPSGAGPYGAPQQPQQPTGYGSPYGPPQQPGYAPPGPHASGYAPQGQQPPGPPPGTPYGTPPQSPGNRYQAPVHNPYASQAAPYGPPQQPGYAPPHTGYAPTQSGQPTGYGQPYGQPNPYQQQPYGTPGYAPYGQGALVPTGGTTARSPAAASLLSAFFPGAGQLYNGQVGKGLFFFFSTVMLMSLGPVAFIPWLWGVADAYSTTRRSNQQPYGLLPHQP